MSVSAYRHIIRRQISHLTTEELKKKRWEIVNAMSDVSDQDFELHEEEWNIIQKEIERELARRPNLERIC